ncbi:winged helix-turn-helix transcriptional regulator [Metallosphaera tengchongensis]|uniref:Winged helix-turn-helix transcriptional regulator n=2 Tax=Metallosphaera tengchongensis TaxID=1532350 RepID=A0A6N0P109_9CREN|nr:winged helix-turn-helix transcriptional regulator [Metallosphaera tengchongensis]QKR00950.1 winged helix-turn-helix transcriptional regulator [Metallosphaera tengchongensis]
MERGDDGISQQELAKSLGLSTRELAVVIKKLIEKKMITKKAIRENGKSVIKLFAIRTIEESNIRINLVSIENIPCFSCKLLFKCDNGAHVNPSSCTKLSSWILSLV